MAIKHIRIDERLIHGQVAGAWSNTIGVNRIMVVNNEANRDDFTKQMLRMATPSALALSVLTYEKAVDRIKNGQYDKDKVLMVIKSISDALELYESGYEFDTVNIGNISAKDQNEALVKGVYINEADQEAIDKLKEKGVKVTVQMTPQDPVKEL